MRFYFVTRILCLLAAAIIPLTACDKLRMPRWSHDQTAATQAPIAVMLEFDEVLRQATVQQTVCADTPWEAPLGHVIMSAFEDEAHARFQKVLIDPTKKDTDKPNLTVRLRLLQKSFDQLDRTGSGENFMARLDVQVLSTFLDADGRMITEGPLIYSKNVSLWTPRVGTGMRGCMTTQLDEEVGKAGKALANQMMQVVAGIMSKTQVASGAPVVPKGEAAGAAQAVQSTAGFATVADTIALKATFTDDNQNQTVEPGENITLRIDATNTGSQPIATVPLTLSGSPGMIEAFEPSLSAGPILLGPLPPGETRSTILTGRMPASIQESRAELTLSTGPDAAVSATPVTIIAAVPAPQLKAESSAQPSPPQSTQTTGIDRQANRYAVVVGLSLYRSPWPGWKEGLSFDSKETAAVFSGTLGVPAGNTLLLQDELATQTDIEEALSSWLPKRSSNDSVVFFYFAGQSVADPATGEISLIPYDSTPGSSPFRLISLRYLQSRLQKLNAKAVLSIIDGPLTTKAPSKDGKKTKAVAPNWLGDLNGSTDLKGSPLIQVSRTAQASQPARGLLNGLTASADVDQDGTVTVGEWLRSMKGKAITAPTLPPTLAIQSIPLAKAKR